MKHGSFTMNWRKWLTRPFLRMRMHKSIWAGCFEVWCNLVCSWEFLGNFTAFDIGPCFETDLSFLEVLWFANSYARLVGWRRSGRGISWRRRTPRGSRDDWRCVRPLVVDREPPNHVGLSHYYASPVSQQSRSSPAWSWDKIAKQKALLGTSPLLSLKRS